MASLETLGERICIIGPSSSGKSTLANAIAVKLGAPATHLDQLAFHPDTDWALRPATEFAALHDAAIAEPAWVIEGNYSRTLPQRLKRATGAIVMETGPLGNTFRYIRRTLCETSRIGGLDGAPERLKFEMLRYVVWGQPTLAKTVRLVERSGLPLVRIGSIAALNALYEAWGLTKSPPQK